MERLRTADLRAVVDFVGGVHAAASHREFRLHTLARLRALVASDMAAWVETRVGRSEVRALADPHDLLPDGPRRFARIRDEHPVLAHFERARDGRAVKLSDFLGPRELHRRRLYDEFFRPAGVEHQMSIALPSRGARLVRITLNRARGDFGERDRAVLNLVRPHVARAHASAEAFARIGAACRDLERAAEAADVGVAVARGGRVAYVSPRARALLARYFGSDRRGLPAAVAEWCAAASHAPLVVDRDGSRLEVRSVVDDGGRVLVLRERVTRVAPRTLEALGLTRRQAEVLALVAQGRSNGGIAAALGISTSTVARHVEAIFAALGVQSRTAAAAVAFGPSS